MRLPLIVLFFFFVLSAFGQNYSFTRFSVEEGLPRSGVYCMLEDRDGFLWVGTEGGGVAVFNGQNFELFNSAKGLSNNTVRTLMQDSNGNIWMGTNGSGVVRYNGKEFLTINESNDLSNNYVRSLVEDDDGNIWAGTYGGGLNKISFTQDTFNIEVFGSLDGLPSDIIRYAIKDSDGTVWFGTDGGLVKMIDEKFTNYSVSEGLPHKKVLVLFEDMNRNIWIGSKKGATKFDGKTFTTISSKDGLISDRVRAIAQDRNGSMWFGTKQGVSRFENGKFTSFTEQNGLSNNRIRNIISDTDGDLWFGTYFGGICRYSGEAFIHFSRNEGLPNEQIESVAENKDGLWVGSRNGVALIRKNKFSYEVNPTPFDGELAGFTVNDISQNNNKTWFGTDEGVFVKNGNKLDYISVDGAAFTEDVKCLLPTENSLWVGSADGVSWLRKEEGLWTLKEYFSQSNINEGSVSSLLKDAQNRIWIGFLKKGLLLWDGTNFNEINLPENVNTVTSLAIGPNGLLWIGTDGSGLFSTRLLSGVPKPSDFKSINNIQPKLTQNIHQLIFDTKGNLWVGTPNGVQKLELNNRAEIKELKEYGASEGFGGSETSLNATCLDSAGNLWFGSIKGLTRYAPNKDIKNQSEPRIHITHVELDGDFTDKTKKELMQGSVSRFHLPEKLNLPYQFRNIEFQFIGIDLKNPSKIGYQWKLEGYDRDWSGVRQERAATYTNLPTGNYTFKVRARNGDGTFSTTPAEFSFRIVPPIWMRWWFISICVVILGLLIRVFIKLREKQFIEEQKRLQAMVDERTKELRSEKERSDELLLNILPIETADELKSKGHASVHQYNLVSVLFTDFVGFTQITENISHKELVRSLDEHFRLFDGIMNRYGIEKIKTIGDAYMAAGGIPTANQTNPIAVVMAGLEMINSLHKLNQSKGQNGNSVWQLRLGIHTGEVISGVVGENKFAYDIWGDAVNTAARMESSGEAMKVNISGATHHLIKDYFACTFRGKIKAKNKGEIDMYFVERLLPKYSHGNDGLTPNEDFLSAIGKQN